MGEYLWYANYTSIKLFKKYNKILPSHSLEWLKFKRLATVWAGKNIKQWEHLCFAGRSVKWCNHFKKTFGSFLKS